MPCGYVVTHSHSRVAIPRCGGVLNRDLRPLALPYVARQHNPISVRCMTAQPDFHCRGDGPGADQVRGEGPGASQGMQLLGAGNPEGGVRCMGSGGSGRPERWEGGGDEGGGGRRRRW
ncbi:hypothetical protein PLESTF_001849700 [Pleodorina starrii]|nr:hypothetical protein PLESTF_001849700 [Pleodorina starrii]